MRLLFLPGEITERHCCCDRIEPFRKHPANPVLVADRPWESSVSYPCVLRSERDGLWKMWYEADDLHDSPRNPSVGKIDGAEIRSEVHVCCAFSSDGLTWTKPALNLMRTDDYPDNNIVLDDSGLYCGVPTVVEDLDDPNPERLYKMLLYDNDGRGREGARTAVSADGIVWTYLGGFPTIASQDTPSLWHDRRRGRYVAFLKTRLDNRRARLISVSEDFVTWSEPKTLLAPELSDPQTMHFYAQSAFHHWGQDLGLLNCYDESTQLACLELISAPSSTDWRRLPTRPKVLNPGDSTAWDGGGIYSGQGEPALADGVYRYYYYGQSGRHDVTTDTQGGVGVATFCEGRLAGQQFTGEGFFQSLPFRCPGGKLTLNVVAREPVRIEVFTTGYGSPIEPFTRQACLAVVGDGTVIPVRWHGAETLDALRGRFIQLRISGSDALVYGCEMA
jgi:hypothetical protein